MGRPDGGGHGVEQTAFLGVPVLAGEHVAHQTALGVSNTTDLPGSAAPPTPRWTARRFSLAARQLPSRMRTG